MGLETLLIAGIVMSLAGAGMSAYSQYQAGESQKDAFDYQAKLNKQRAAMAETQGHIKQRQQDIEFGQKLAYAQTASASAGLSLGAGSTLDYSMSAQEQHAIEKQIISRNAGMESWGYNASAAMNRFEGKSISLTSTMGAIGTGMSGLGSAAMMGSKLAGADSPGGGTSYDYVDAGTISANANVA